VRVIAHDQHEAEGGPGIGKTVSDMARQRMAEREALRLAAPGAGEKPGKGRGRGR
jgi:hypothetical protein